MNDLDFQETKYIVKLSSDFIPSNEIFIYLYKPLLGSSAICLYHLLYADAKNQNAKESTLSRLSTLTGDDDKIIQRNYNKLFLLGLTTIFRDKRDANKIFIVLNKPLDVFKFISNNTLKKMLEEKIGKEELEKNISYLKDVMFVMTNELEVVKQEQTNEIELGKDLITENIFNTKAIRKILSIAEVNLDFWNDEIDRKIVDLILIHDLDSVQIAEKIQKIIINKGEFSIKELEKELNENTVEEGLVLQLDNNLTANIENKLEIFREINPIDFIKIRLQRTPTTDELKFIKEQKEITRFDNTYINILLDYSTIKNNGVISIPYLTKIVKTILEKNIDNEEDLITWLKSAHKMSRNKNKNKIQDEIELEELTNNNTKIDIMEDDFTF